MGLFQTIILALVQGITEFLPISSSAHLILVPLLTDWPDQGLGFDVALNTATWLAVVIYMREDIGNIVSGLIRAAREKNFRGNHDAQLGIMVAVATIPVALAGLLARDTIANGMRTLEVIAISSIVWGIVLWLADRRPRETMTVKTLTWPAAIFVGLVQAIALIPGTSRSGITMTGGLFAGLSRTGAAKFSFLLAIIVGALAGGKEAIDMAQAGMNTPWLYVGVGFVVAFIAAYAAIHYFLKLISHASMVPFVIYRVLLGIILLVAF